MKRIVLISVLALSGSWVMAQLGSGLITPQTAMSQSNWDALCQSIQTTASQNGSKAPGGAGVELTYRPEAKVSAQLKSMILDGMIAESRKRGKYTAQGESQLRSAFAKLSVTEVWKPSLDKLNLEPEDMVAALTTFAVVGFELLDDGKEFPAETNRLVYNQFKSAFAKNPNLAKMPDADRQKFSEACYWVAYVNALDFGNAQKATPGYTLENVKESVRQSMKSFRIDPDVLTINEKGLARK